MFLENKLSKQKQKIIELEETLFENKSHKFLLRTAHNVEKREIFYENSTQSLMPEIMISSHHERCLSNGGHFKNNKSNSEDKQKKYKKLRA